MQSTIKTQNIVYDYQPDATLPVADFTSLGTELTEAPVTAIKRV
ncbi:hypothetical protein [Lactiplantibacillus plantarum]|nr:hypothetical protein [Lactiplantibacillus plantarum]